MIKLIAETAWHHDGDYEFMANLIDLIVKSPGEDIVKLHITLDLDEYIDASHPGYAFLKERMFSTQQWEQLILKIRSYNKELMLLLNDTKSVDFAKNFRPDYIEIHSVCLNDYHLLYKIRESKLSCPIMLGVGGSTLYEIENTINYLKAKDNSQEIILMHGFQNYPTKYEDINFNKIRKIMKMYPNYQHGYADHTAWDEPNNLLISSLGAALGMDFLEKHITTVPGEKRTDWQAAISIEDFKLLAKTIQILNACNGNGSLRLNEGEKSYSIFGPNKKAALYLKDIKQGEVLSLAKITFKRIGKQVDLSQLEAWDLMGKKTNQGLNPNSIIKKEHFD